LNALLFQGVLLYTLSRLLCTTRFT